MLSKCLGIKLNRLQHPASDLANLKSWHWLLFLYHAKPSPPRHFSTYRCPHLEPLSTLLCVWLLLGIQVSAQIIPSQESPPWPTWSLPDPPMSLSSITLFYQFTHSPGNYPEVSCLLSWMFFVFFPYHHRQDAGSGRHGLCMSCSLSYLSVHWDTVSTGKAFVGTEQQARINTQLNR